MVLHSIAEHGTYTMRAEACKGARKGSFLPRQCSNGCRSTNWTDTCALQEIIAKVHEPDECRVYYREDGDEPASKTWKVSQDDAPIVDQDEQVETSRNKLEQS